MGSAIIYTIANFTVAGVPFLLLPILTRNLSPEEYGAVAMFMVVVAFMAVGAGLNTHGAIMIRYHNSDLFQTSTYVSSVLFILLASTSVLAIIVYLGQASLELYTGLPITWIAFAVFVASSQFIVQILLTLWQASGQPTKFASLRISQATLDGVLSLFLVITLTLSWEGRLLGIGAAWGISAIAAFYFLNKGGWLVKTPDRYHAKDALRYGIPLLPHAMAGLALAMTDRFLVTNLMDLTSTGIYMVAVQIGMILQIAADAFNKAFAPWLINALHTANINRDKKIVRYTYLYFFVILSIAIGIGAASDFIVYLVAGDQYKEAADIAKYTLIGNAFVGMYFMVTNYVFFSRRTELLSLTTTIIGVATFGLTYYLIKINGATGAAQAFMISQILMFLVTWYIANKCHSMPWGLRSK
ncbi:oligosaccharide flippase family protein [Limnobacter sp.]|uniref:lipopolysaccharide biosynthesis protein n=1 Tax=Limnobacter sp. TaxID=2003368 RepID=UPI0031202DA2